MLSYSCSGHNIWLQLHLITCTLHANYSVLQQWKDYMHSNACGIPTESAIIKFSFKEWRKTVILGSARNASVTTNFYINYTHVAYHIFVVLFFYSLLNSNFATLNETVVIQLDVNNGFCLYGLSPSVKRSYYIFIESCISSLLKRQTKNTTEHGEKKTVTSRMNCPCLSQSLYSC